MASDARTAAHVLEVIAGAGSVSVRRMFGEYAVYLDGKVVGLICDNRVFVKPTPGALALVAAPELAEPYPRVKPQICADGLLDDAELLVRVLRAVADDLPPPAHKTTRRARLAKPG
jgi:hypothetical protein